MQNNVSIVIPVYNVQDYLPHCLKMLNGQTDDFIEVVLVNDGSTDGSLAICEEYARNHPNVVLINQENGGLSDARNVGTAAATGKYIYYLDSDDWLAPNAIRTLFDFAVENDCEAVQGGFYYAYDDHLLYDAKYKNSFVLKRDEAMLQLIKNEYVKNFAWGKLYKSEIVKRYQFPKRKFYEDSYWQHLVMNEVNNYGIVPTPLYYYRQRNTGISGEFSIRNLDLLTGYEERLLFVQKHYPEYINEIASLLWNLSYTYTKTARKYCDQSTISKYAVFLPRVYDMYKNVFDDALHSDIKYKLWKTFPQLIPFYELIRKIGYKIFGKSTFVKLEYDGAL